MSRPSSPLPSPALTRRSFMAAAVSALPAGRVLAAQPLAFDHVWGRTELAAPARRVVSLGYTTHDTLLALGVVPLALRYWYGASETGVWPWAEPLLNGARPEVLRGEVSMERVAAQQPDLIVALGSGISRAEYEVLSRIAPTLMHKPGRNAYDTPWDELTLTLGRATGTEARAATLVAQVRAEFAAAQARHPTWQGKTAAAAYFWAGTSGAFLPGDARVEFLEALGFTQPESLRDLAGRGAFFRDLSPEDLSPLDADLLVWVSAFDTAPDLAALPMRHTLRAWREGREVFAGQLLASALSHASVLSMPYALTALEPDLAAALDGDAATAVASSVQAGLAP